MLYGNNVKVWLFNFLGVKLHDEDLADMPRPRLELGFHHTLRFTQGGAIFGTLIVGSIAAAMRAIDGEITASCVAKMAFRCGAFGILFGLMVGPKLSYASTRHQPLEVVQYRCYRLRCNKKLLRRDKMSLAGAALGYAISRYHPSNPVPMLVAIFGLCMGMLVADIYTITRTEKKKSTTY